MKNDGEGHPVKKGHVNLAFHGTHHCSMLSHLKKTQMSGLARDILFLYFKSATVKCFSTTISLSNSLLDSCWPDLVEVRP